MANQPQVPGIIGNEANTPSMIPNKTGISYFPKTINHYHFKACQIAHYKDKTRQQWKPAQQPTKKWPISPQTLQFLPSHGVDDC
jgi:hypothetical protein